MSAIQVTGSQGGVDGVTAADISALLGALASAQPTCIVCPGQFLPGGPAAAAQQVLSGAVWVSYGGFPMYYSAAPSSGGTTYGSANGIQAFLTAIGATLPAGIEFYAGGSTAPYRVLTSTSPNLPAGWVGSGLTTVLNWAGTADVYAWPMVGVQASSGGWWFYASGDVGGITPQAYADFILQNIQTAAPPSGVGGTPSGARWPLLAVSGMGLVGVLIGATQRRGRHRRRRR